ncbi:uncharacterized protein [Temnothorax longispinosus]|uniref:uncharacterized protein isoform X2 n=1 Tax=Temnothorax longispinosus TaxID=300112 RepID=UPI003A9A65CD
MRRRHLLYSPMRRIDRLIIDLFEEGISIDRSKRGDERNVLDIFAVTCVSMLEEMISAKDRYFSLNRILLLAIGLWPYKQSKLVQLQLTLHYGILGSFIIFQFTTFATTKCDLQLVIEILSVTTVFFNFVITYFSFHFNMDFVKYLLDLLQHTYDDLKDEGEIAIIEKYWSVAKRYTEALTLLVVFSVTSFILTPFLPYIYDIVFSANASRPNPSLQIVTEYFIDQERYFYLIILHTDAAFCIGGLTIVAIGTMFILYMQHVCGMLKITSYLQLPYGADHDNQYYTNERHEKCEFDSQEHHLCRRYASQSFKIFREISSGQISGKVLQSLIYVNMYYLYTFLCNDISQQLMDENNGIFATVYNVQWYMAPLHIQKLILFLLQRGNKTLQIFVGGMIKGSLECFVTLASASISYFTFIYYTNQ